MASINLKQRNDRWQRFAFVGLVAGLVTASVGCSKTPAEQPAVEAPDESAVVQPTASEETAMNTGAEIVAGDFDYGLLKQLYAAEPGKNLFLSPASIGMALAMTRNGAAGTTLAEMNATLGYAGMTEEQIVESDASTLSMINTPGAGIEMSMANSIWANKGLLLEKSFTDLVTSRYKAEATTLDFAAASSAKRVNDWISDQTHDKITDVVPDPLPSDLELLLVNAIYFKGSWMRPFDEKSTKPQPFHAPAATFDHPMMNMDGEFQVFDGEGFMALRLGYGDTKEKKDGGVGMVVLLPNEGTTVESVVTKLDDASWESWRVQFNNRNGHIGIPRFKIEWNKSLVETLTAMGIRSAFGGTADFSRMGPGLMISDVLHKAFVEVNEEGTEAAAATVVAIARTSMIKNERVNFVADRPFVFLIEHRDTGRILFAGVLNDPRS